MKSAQISSILYYKFTPVPDPELLRLWQWELCGRLGLSGRILISRHGINGTLGGDRRALRRYLVACRDYQPLGELDAKWSHDLGQVPFPKLSVKARPELVAFGFTELQVDAGGVVGGGTHLNAEALRELLASLTGEDGKEISELAGGEVLLLDARNDYEHAVGRFKGALNPGVASAREFIPFIESGAIDAFKDKPVITYCTGGVRCEILTPLLKARGFTSVFQLDGGIVRYLAESHNRDGLWEGSVYTFDGRTTLLREFAEPVGVCVHCGGTTENYADCRPCDAHVLVCPDCWEIAARRCPDCLAESAPA